MAVKNTSGPTSLCLLSRPAIAHHIVLGMDKRPVSVSLKVNVMHVTVEIDARTMDSTQPINLVRKLTKINK
jgi:hypothetical protein